jgi:hypothetical protein
MLALFPEISQKAQIGDLESLAVLIRTYFAGEQATKPRLDALATVRSFGIPVGMAPIKYFGAIAVRDDSGDIRASIIIRDQLTREQQSFVLCHLLGHFVLQIQPRLAKTEWTSSGFKELIEPGRRYAFGEGVSGVSAQDFAAEDAADRFAGALLMPGAMLRRAMAKLADADKVAAIFGVSKEVLERRLDDLGAAHPAEPLVRAGARVATPIDVLNQLADSDHEIRSVPAEQLIREVNQPVASMSRAVAAHSYQDAAQSESAARADAKKEKPTRQKGMDRIRELAMKMDKFSEKSKS